MSSLVIASFGIFLLAIFPSAYLLVATARESPLRILWVATLPVLAHHLFTRLNLVSTSNGLVSVLVGQAGVVLLQCINLLVVTALDQAKLREADILRQDDNTAMQTARVAALILNLRGIGTPWEAKNIRPFPKLLFAPGSKAKIDKTRFILRQMAIIAWQYLCLDMLHDSALSTPEITTDKMFGVDEKFEYQYFNLTPEQWAGRVSIGVAAGLLPARIFIDLPYRVVGLVFVITGINEPDEWRPMFGSVFDAYTLRGVWSRYWHQMCRWPLTPISEFVVRDVMRVPRPSSIRRYLSVLVIFACSGAVHTCFGYYDRMRTNSDLLPIMCFFCLFAVGVFVEDTIQRIWRRIKHQYNVKPPNIGCPLWHKVVGFAWVLGWAIMTAPWFLYPEARYKSSDNWFVPYKVTPLLGQKVAAALLVGGGLAITMFLEGQV